MRSMWKGAISFGLVMIPVKLYAATEQRDVTFRQVHARTAGGSGSAGSAELDGEEVPFADVAKGYELADGEMVVLTDEDLAELPLPTAHSIEVVNFTPADQMDPILVNRSYYVEPEKAGMRAYALLRDALERSGKVALARVALRQRESLATLRARDGVMVLETLLWPDEVRERRLRVPGRGHRGAVAGAEDGVLADRLDDGGLRSRAVPRQLPGGAGGTGGGQGAGPGSARAQVERPAAGRQLPDALKASLDAAGKDRTGTARKRPPRKRASA